MANIIPVATSKQNKTIRIVRIFVGVAIGNS